MRASRKGLRNNKTSLAIRIFAYIFLSAGSLLMIYPVVFILLSSLFTPQEFFQMKFGLFPIPKNPTFTNIKQLFFIGADVYNIQYFSNTLLRTLYGTLNAALTALLAGYVFARLKFKFKGAIFMVLLSTQMLPGVFSIMPTYITLYRFPFAGGNNIFMGGRGLFDTMGVYILLNGPAISIIGMFLVRQALHALPTSLEEAAKVDGAGTFRIIFQIVLPMVRAVLAYLVIITAIGIWNDWQVSHFYTQSRSLRVLGSALSKITSTMGTPGIRVDYPLIMTFSLLLTLPSVIIFFIFQKNIVQGLVSAGIKG